MSNPLPSFTIDLRAIKAAALAMSKEQTRYYLMGVCLDIDPAHGAIAVATDGHRLIACLATEASALPAMDAAQSIIIPADTVKRIKITRRVFDAMLRDNGDGTWSIIYGDTIHAFKPVDGTFPTWRRVLPRHSSPGARAHYNPDYLADFKAAAAVYDGGVEPSVIEDGQSPAWVRFPEHIPAIGVVMPKRHGFHSYMEAPSWAGVTLDPPAAK
jgi:hypothetical protein